MTRTQLIEDRFKVRNPVLSRGEDKVITPGLPHQNIVFFILGTTCSASNKPTGTTSPAHHPHQHLER
ncbi:hypothetical protein HFC64_03395 [Saccharolobus solfataricus]|uniref:Uncharacterized protein n=1 Tax=Saccharolobus solfataricus TaxID=2287 RepID=A0A7S9IG76_SACSO|nr:hypothetical protein [Saccharolobus solfataricus]QPG48575.1 hypothetical protein HFC64_03395 [Saccharolobus solfataricus]